MEIRAAAMAELPEIMAIYARARRFMAEHGNPRQWGITRWPPEALIREDIRQGNLRVCTDGTRLLAVFLFLYGENPEPLYDGIRDGQWLKGGPYGVVHRIASAGVTRGAGAFCLEWAYAQCGHLRIDTHPDNTVMQALLDRLGFQRRGIVYVSEDGDPRIAYEKL